MHTISTEALSRLYEFIWDCVELGNSGANDDTIRELTDLKFLELVGQKREILLPQYGTQS